MASTDTMVARLDALPEQRPDVKNPPENVDAEDLFGWSVSVEVRDPYGEPEVVALSGASDTFAEAFANVDSIMSQAGSILALFAPHLVGAAVASVATLDTTLLYFDSRNVRH